MSTFNSGQFDSSTFDSSIGSLSVTFANVSLSATGKIPAKGNLSATLASSTMSGTGRDPSKGSLSVTLGAAAISATGKIPAKGSLSVTVSAALSATGTIISPAHGYLSLTLNPTALSAAGHAAATGNLSATLASSTMSAIAIKGRLTPATPTALGPVARFGYPLCYYGIGTRYRGLQPLQPTPLQQPLRSGVTVKIYDRTDQLIQVISSNAGRSLLQKLTFDLLDTGPGQFTLQLLQQITINHDYRVDVHLWNSPAPIYSGFVQTIPVAGTTEHSWEIGGFGWFAKSEDTLITGVYNAGSYPHQMATDIATQFATNTGNRVSVGTISTTTQSTDIYQVDSNGNVLTGLPIAYVTYSTAGNVQFIRTPMKDAMKTVVDLSGQYVWGVDANRRFFFQPISQAVTDDARWWAGRHMETYVPAEDSSKIKNQVYIKLGTVRRDLPPTAPLWATNFLDLPLNDLPSQALYGIRSEVYSAPAALNPTDATRAAAVELDRLCIPIQKATVTGIDFTGTPVLPVGAARIMGIGGNALVLQKVKVAYTVQGSSVKMDVQLGQLDRTPGTLVNTVTKAISEAALIQSNTQNHASTA